ncbi:hypothetical protein FVEN_g10191 [Fusarium venenatum]|uniref:EH domain-containing protein n=1 Tax=Fusarium venenatum TaxID=56646 RepID=A0A2L2TM06_9HYPO|nr:uncharacterized protein FVRRES_03123 [Fusarium venenatum]KAG8351766.1 hypothetical protein FVEN_g10191 [Fusarium venenatum]KAH7003828.1 hypothetical protein EDB82DRAFT_485257 [Fusarium venenatum]CEI66611.1 unnamed protein product [Fusarium venenatum]
MLIRDSRKLLLFVVPVLFFIIVALKLYLDPAGVQDWVPSQLKKSSKTEEVLSDQESTHVSDSQPTPEVETEPAPQDDSPFGKGVIPQDISSTHNELFSLSTKDKKFFEIKFEGFTALNPNVIPHPTLDNTWIVVAQWLQEGGNSLWFAELVCNAAFKDDVLTCITHAVTLPVTPTIGGNKCQGDLLYFHMSMGPHDGRVFYGPEKPYTTYGTNSLFTCLGQFVQDFRTLVSWPGDMANLSEFRVGTELQRPQPWRPMEKNFFLFWDSSGSMYTHYDIAPKRVFSQTNADGSAGPDLAPAATGDEQCMAKYLPKLTSDLESVHQTTNSLLITMCRRDEPMCVPNDENTFIMVIYQHKSYFDYHAVYEPYVMLFKQRAPFEVHALSKKPIWIHGRKQYPEKSTSDMFYVTSMSWKSKEQKYHGFIGDEMFLGFGIEDTRTGGIDIRAEDLVKDMGLCFEA